MSILDEFGLQDSGQSVDTKGSGADILGEFGLSDSSALVDINRPGPKIGAVPSWYEQVFSGLKRAAAPTLFNRLFPGAQAGVTLMQAPGKAIGAGLAKLDPEYAEEQAPGPLGRFGSKAEVGGEIFSSLLPLPSIKTVGRLAGMVKSGRAAREAAEFASRHAGVRADAVELALRQGLSPKVIPTKGFADEASAIEAAVERISGTGKPQNLRAALEESLQVVRPVAAEGIKRGIEDGRIPQEAAGIVADSAAGLADDEAGQVVRAANNINWGKGAQRLRQGYDVLKLWRAGGMLSTLRGATRDLIVTSANVFVAKPIKSTIAGTLGRLLPGEKMFAGEGAAEFAGSFSSLVPNLRLAARAARSGSAYEQFYQRAVEGMSAGTKFATAIPRGAIKLRSGLDQLLFDRAMAGNVWKEAYRRAAAKKTTFDGELQALMRDLPNKLPELKKMVFDAERAVFSNRNAIASWMNASGTFSKTAEAALDMAIPFRKATINTIKEALNYTPAGLRELFRTGATKESRLEAVSKIIMGAAAMTGVYEMFKGGVIQSSPSYEDMQKSGTYDMWAAKGIAPDSIIIGDYMFDANQAAPFGPLILAATRGESPGKLLAGQGMLEMSGSLWANFLESAADFMSTMKDPDSADSQRFLQRLGASYVPGAIRDAMQIARGGTVVKPDVNLFQEFPSPTQEALQGAAASLGRGTTAINPLGEEKTQTTFNILSPLKKTQVGSPELNELANLGVKVEKADKRLDDPRSRERGKVLELKPEEQAALIRARSEAVRQAVRYTMQSEGYTSLPPEEKKILLSRVIEAFRRQATLEAQQKYYSARE